MRHQTGLNSFLNDFLYALALKIFPDIIDEHEVPALIVLPLGAHPSEKWNGYFDREYNLIVAFEVIGKEALEHAQKRLIHPAFVFFLIHELCHWYQRRKILRSNEPIHGDDHRHYSWGQACYIATTRLFGDVYPLEFFQPEITVKHYQTTRKLPRQGALTWEELKGFPFEQIPEFYEELNEVLGYREVDAA